MLSSVKIATRASSPWWWRTTAHNALRSAIKSCLQEARWLVCARTCVCTGWGQTCLCLRAQGQQLSQTFLRPEGAQANGRVPGARPRPTITFQERGPLCVVLTLRYAGWFGGNGLVVTSSLYQIAKSVPNTVPNQPQFFWRARVASFRPHTGVHHASLQPQHPSLQRHHRVCHSTW